MHGGELPARYDEALWAVLWGLHKGRPLTFHSEAGAQVPTTTAGLYRSSRILYESFAVMQRREAGVAAQHVVKDVLWISSGNLEVMRSHFVEVLWELLSVTERRDVVDKRTSSEMLEGFTVRLRTARTTHDVTHSFTQMVRELLDTVERPGELGRRAKLERARRLVEQGQTNTKLDLASVAAGVGMSRSNFARCFRATYGTTFAEFVLRSRIERSKKLLRSTSLRVAEVSNEAGWSSPSYSSSSIQEAHQDDARAVQAPGPRPALVTGWRALTESSEALRCLARFEGARHEYRRNPREQGSA